MLKIVFLILNYKNVDETIRCIESINYNVLEKWEAVIVDNGSKDGSFEKLTQLYKKDCRIKILLSEENVGFSKGNNLGYEYIRKNGIPDYIVITNNDVLFPDKNMFNKIDKIYKNTHFYVYGPDIYVQINKEHQSPIKLSMPTINELQQELSMYEYYEKYPKKWVTRRKLQVIKNKICHASKAIRKIYNILCHHEKINREKIYENACIQGACIIVSKDYIVAEEKMFNPEPFLYCEELFLYKKCLDKGYKIIYNPEVQVLHEDSATVKKINANKLERAKFTLKHHVAARKMLIEYCKANNFSEF